MYNYIRKQQDGRGDEYSQDAGLRATGDGRTRQEDAHDLDINVILARSGAAGLIRRQERNGEVDYNMDRFQALAAIADARTFHSRLPDGLKHEFPTWTDVLRTMDDGTFKTILDNYNKTIRLSDTPDTTGTNPEGGTP